MHSTTTTSKSTVRKTKTADITSTANAIIAHTTTSVQHCAKTSVLRETDFAPDL